LYSKLGLAFKEVEGYGFLDYVEDAKRQWQGKAKSQR